MQNRSPNMLVTQPNTGIARIQYYGFQGQEKDDEVKGRGNSVNYTYRMHDPRLGRFFAVDPLTPQYPHNSPYAFSENIVIHGRELEGAEVYFFMLEYTDNTKSQLQLVLHDVIDAKIYTLLGPVDMNQGEINLIKGTDGEWHQLPLMYANLSLSVFGEPDEIFEAINSFPIRTNAQQGLNYKNNVEAIAPVLEAFAGIIGGLAVRRSLPEVVVKPNKGARLQPKDLQEKLALKEAKSGQGTKWDKPLGDKKYHPETGKYDKYKHNHDHGDGTSTEVHYDVNRKTGKSSGFKIKDDTNANSRGRMYGEETGQSKQKK